MANPFDQFDEPERPQRPINPFDALDAPQRPVNPFDEFDAPQPVQTEASGVFEAFQAGYQGSATGLAIRGKLPDIYLNPEEADWYERLASGVGTIVSELPIGIVGAVGGGAAGAAAGTAVPIVGNVAGGVVGAGAGSMALPAAIRESYIQAYTKGEIESTADFINRVGLVMKQTAKEGLIGGATAGFGRAAGLTAQAAGAGAKTTMAATLTAEGATLVMAPAALEGRLPEPQEFMDAAILLVGFKAATMGAAKLAEIYRRTGKTPAEVVADAAKDPTIARDLESGVYVYHGTKAQGINIEQLSVSSDLGPHLTVSRKTADIFANEEGAPGIVLEGVAGFSKSLELPDLGAWFPTDVAQAIDNARGVKPQADGQTPLQAEVWRAMQEAQKTELDKGVPLNETLAASNEAGYKVIRDALRAEGYDSIKYINKSEGEPVDTYIALDMSKVKAKPAETSPVDGVIPRAYQEQARQENARNAVPPPSKEAAEFIEKPFAEVPQLPGEPVLKTHVNYNYINTTEDVKGAMSRLSELYESNMRAATRETVTWEQTYAQAKEIYRTTTGEEPPPTPLANADYAKLSADLYARKQLLVSGVEQMMNLRNEYAKARAENRATDQMRLEILAQVDRVAQVQAETRGAQAEVGRALNVLKSTRRDKAYYDELNFVLNERFKTGRMDQDIGNRAAFDTIIDLLGTFDKPNQVLKFAEKMKKPNFLDKLAEYYQAALVSGFITQTANILGTFTVLPLRPMVDVLAVGYGAFRKGPDKVVAAEPFYRTAAMFLGTMDAFRIAGGVLKTGIPYKAEPDYMRAAIAGRLGKFVRIPFRLLSTSDAFFRVVNERAEAYALAARQATNEGLNPLTREFRKRVAEIAADPPEAMMEKIEAAGLRFTFQAPLGAVGKGVLNMRRQSPLLNLVVPFVQSPINSVKEMLRLTPLSPAVKEWRDAIRAGGAERDKAIAEVALGLTIGATVMALVDQYDGKNQFVEITGSGPPEPQKRSVKMADNWQPRSIRIGGTWYAYDRIQPLGGLIGMYADTKEIWDRATKEEQAKITASVGIAFANAITNQTMLQGIASLIEALNQPERFAEAYIEGLVSTAAVPAVVSQTASLIDPYQREVYSIYDAIINRIPIARETLQPKRDVFGEEIESPNRILGVLPIRTSEVSEDKVRNEAARLGLGVSFVGKYIELPAMRQRDLARVDLTPEQRDIFAEQSGKMAYTILDQLVNSPGWDDMPDIIQRQTMERVFRDAREYGRAFAVPPEQLMQEYERIGKGLSERLQQE